MTQKKGTKVKEIREVKERTPITNEQMIQMVEHDKTFLRLDGNVLHVEPGLVPNMKANRYIYDDPLI
jgi:hypothetical protein